MPATSVFAATRPVNPSGAAPSITEKQLWKGLEFKARNRASFAPNVIASSAITSDNGKNIVCELRMKCADLVVTEEIEFQESSIVYFKHKTGDRATSMISYGPADELLLTISVAYACSTGMFEGYTSTKELNARLGKEVKHDLDLIRQMVKEGKL
ncbi:hypothetical protein C8J57DRAFT_1313027 [Mycena rebaudengoi]|nr:hypothetical protein C8J57DRAFT_1313027 [Mycena rebaudengoi]